MEHKKKKQDHETFTRGSKGNKKVENLLHLKIVFFRFFFVTVVCMQNAWLKQI